MNRITTVLLNLAITLLTGPALAALSAYEYLDMAESTQATDKIRSLKAKYVSHFVNKNPAAGHFGPSDFRQVIERYNQLAPGLPRGQDPIDAFLALLPETYRTHFTLVHRSFSIQGATPLSPRAIVFGADAQVILSFNAGLDESGRKQDGGQAIEVIEWHQDRKAWEFAELTFSTAERRLKREDNPAKCIMCHSGTPKAIDVQDAKHYVGRAKPIFAQYPLWPGFYGSVNDIIGIDRPGSTDSVMRTLAASIDHVKSLTFSNTEELFRLRELLDNNPAYLKVIEDEFNVHRNFFGRFMSGMKSRPRYRQLITLSEYFTRDGQRVPDYLHSAPYRRSFHQADGHYLMRPNFHLSTLLTFRQAQVVAEEIKRFPLYQKFKFSLLARKYNCGEVREGNLSLKDLDPSFDLVYPNVSSQASMDRQYLLAYQYNLARAGKGGPAHLPLHAWNLEANEDISSYHFGNVFSDLNELVLWQLAADASPLISYENGRKAALERHYELNGHPFLDRLFTQSGGLAARMTNTNLAFANSARPYNDSRRSFVAMPVASECARVFIPGAREELRRLAREEQLPHQLYSLDPELGNTQNYSGQRGGISVARAACESCHQPEDTSHQIRPRINVDWWSDSYQQDLFHQQTNHPDEQTRPLHEQISQTLNNETLPVPFGKQMPYGRRMDDFSRQCEELIVANYVSHFGLRGKRLYNCQADTPDSLDCRCRKLQQTRERIYRKYYQGPHAD
jgi:cytochrome c553